jgi:hypothetical protein
MQLLEHLAMFGDISQPMRINRFEGQQRSVQSPLRPPEMDCQRFLADDFPDMGCIQSGPQLV